MTLLRYIYPSEVCALNNVYMERVNIDIARTDIAMEYPAIKCNVVNLNSVSAQPGL